MTDDSGLTVFDAMVAAHPAARPTLTFIEFFECSPHAALPGFNKLSVFHPADKFVARERRDIFPGRASLLIGEQCFLQICRHFMDDTARKSVFRNHIFIVLHQWQLYYAYFPAFSRSAMIIFFIFSMALIAASPCMRSPMFLGMICQLRPNLSFSQPHCSDSGTADIFSQK